MDHGHFKNELLTKNSVRTNVLVLLGFVIQGPHNFILYKLYA